MKKFINILTWCIIIVVSWAYIKFSNNEVVGKVAYVPAKTNTNNLPLLTTLQKKVFDKDEYTIEDSYFSGDVFKVYKNWKMNKPVVSVYKTYLVKTSNVQIYSDKDTCMSKTKQSKSILNFGNEKYDLYVLSKNIYNTKDFTCQTDKVYILIGTTQIRSKLGDLLEFEFGSFNSVVNTIQNKINMFYETTTSIYNDMYNKLWRIK